MAIGECSECGSEVDIRAGHHDCDWRGKVARLTAELERTKTALGLVGALLRQLRDERLLVCTSSCEPMNHIDCICGIQVAKMAEQAVEDAGGGAAAKTWKALGAYVEGREFDKAGCEVSKLYAELRRAYWKATWRAGE